MIRQYRPGNAKGAIIQLVVNRMKRACKAAHRGVAIFPGQVAEIYYGNFLL